MTTLTLPGPLFLIGCGNMAGAMLEGWLAAARADHGDQARVRARGEPAFEHRAGHVAAADEEERAGELE